MKKSDFRNLVQQVNDKTYIHENDGMVSQKNKGNVNLLALRKLGAKIIQKTNDPIDKNDLLDYYALLAPIAKWTYFSREGEANLSTVAQTLKTELYPNAADKLDPEDKKELKRRNDEMGEVEDPRFKTAVKNVGMATRWLNNSNSNNNDEDLASNAAKKVRLTPRPTGSSDE